MESNTSARILVNLRTAARNNRIPPETPTHVGAFDTNSRYRSAYCGCGRKRLVLSTKSGLARRVGLEAVRQLDSNEGGGYAINDSGQGCGSGMCGSA